MNATWPSSVRLVSTAAVGLVVVLPTGPVQCMLWRRRC